MSAAPSSVAVHHLPAQPAQGSARARLLEARLHEAGSRDTRAVARADRQDLALWSVGALALVAAMVVRGDNGVAVALVVLLGAGHLWFSARVDVARRRLRWLRGAIAEADACLDPGLVDRLVERAQGDVLAATSALASEVRRNRQPAASAQQPA